MQIATLLALAIVAILVIVTIAKKPTQKRLTSTDDPKTEIFPYERKEVMTAPEQVLYFRLTAALPDNIVLAQVQMSSFLKIKGRQARWRELGSRIREKSCDFVVLAKDASIKAAIELQDRTHEEAERIKSDTFKRRALDAAAIPLIEFHVDAMPSIDEIRQAISERRT